MKEIAEIFNNLITKLLNLFKNNTSQLIEETYDKAIQSLSYVTPEMFGAIGDGQTDDTDALKQALLDPRPIVGTGVYKTTSTLTINKNVYLKNIIYENSDKLSFAFEINEAIRNITLEVRDLKSSCGGIRVIANKKVMLDYITIKVGSILCYHHGISYEAINHGIQYCNIYIDGQVRIEYDKTIKDEIHACLNFKVGRNDIDNPWVGEIKVYGGLLIARANNAWGIYADGYKGNKNITAIRTFGCSLEMDVNGIYLNECNAVDILSARFEKVPLYNWNKKAKGVVLKGKCNNINIDGFGIPMSTIDISELDKNYISPPLITFGLLSRGLANDQGTHSGNTVVGSGYIGGDYRIKVRPKFKNSNLLGSYGSVGTPEEPAQLGPLSYWYYPKNIIVKENSYIEIDHIYDLFGDIKITVDVRSASEEKPVCLYYRIPVSEKLEKICTITKPGIYLLDNYYVGPIYNSATSSKSFWNIIQISDSKKDKNGIQSDIIYLEK